MNMHVCMIIYWGMMNGEYSDMTKAQMPSMINCRF